MDTSSESRYPINFTHDALTPIQKGTLGQPIHVADSNHVFITIDIDSLKSILDSKRPVMNPPNRTIGDV